MGEILQCSSFMTLLSLRYISFSFSIIRIRLFSFILYLETRINSISN